MEINIGSTIRQLRSHRELTLKELAEQTDLSLSYLSLIERNKRDPSLSNLAKIAKAFDLPPSILIFISSDINGHHGTQAAIAEQMMLVVKDLFEDDERFPALP
ncbi:MAG: helix-turn-helix transcriptional regulator [Gammaproteobacteria bacterium]|nr:helix-turn-helix transcriptional regulator [Gammaproteobacteria bacterium]NNL44354.1 helix-turn-helix transcriptional regulator [Woeseiaceae bacterium]